MHLGKAQVCGIALDISRKPIHWEELRTSSDQKGRISDEPLGKLKQRWWNLQVLRGIMMQCPYNIHLQKISEWGCLSKTAPFSHTAWKPTLRLNLPTLTNVSHLHYSCLPMFGPFPSKPIIGPSEHGGGYLEEYVIKMNCLGPVSYQHRDEDRVGPRWTGRSAENKGGPNVGGRRRN